MPLPLMITISPGETAPCRKLAALANVTLVGPGRREVSVKLVLNVEVAAVTTMVPAFGPAVTVVEACPLAPVGTDAEPRDAVPLVTVKVTVAPCTGLPAVSSTFATSGEPKAV